MKKKNPEIKQKKQIISICHPGDVASTPEQEKELRRTVNEIEKKMELAEAAKKRIKKKRP